MNKAKVICFVTALLLLALCGVSMELHLYWVAAALFVPAFLLLFMWGWIADEFTDK